jgi:hypothetical protein
VSSAGSTPARTIAGGTWASSVPSLQAMSTHRSPRSTLIAAVTESTMPCSSAVIVAFVPERYQ